MTIIQCSSHSDRLVVAELLLPSSPSVSSVVDIGKISSQSISKPRRRKSVQFSFPLVSGTCDLSPPIDTPYEEPKRTTTPPEVIHREQEDLSSHATSASLVVSSPNEVSPKKNKKTVTAVVRTEAHDIFLLRDMFLFSDTLVRWFCTSRE